jgi:hypothetical protein
MLLDVIPTTLDIGTLGAIFSGTLGSDAITYGVGAVLALWVGRRVFRMVAGVGMVR